MDTVSLYKAMGGGWPPEQVGAATQGECAPARRPNTGLKMSMMLEIVNCGRPRADTACITSLRHRPGLSAFTEPRPFCRAWTFSGISRDMSKLPSRMGQTQPPLFGQP
jgi:hypothetical protein